MKLDEELRVISDVLPPGEFRMEDQNDGTFSIHFGSRLVGTFRPTEDWISMEMVGRLVNLLPRVRRRVDYFAAEEGKS